MRTLYILLFFLSAFLSPSLAADYFWVGGSGDWSDISHWATSSGSSSKHVVVPGINDDVYFDANSFTGPNQTVTINLANAACRSMVWTGVTNNPTLAGLDIRVQGDLIFSSNMSLSLGGDLYLQAQNQGAVLNFAGLTWPSDIYFNSLSGGWQLQSDLKLIGDIFFEAGTLNVDTRTIELNRWISTGSLARNISMLNGEVLVKASNLGWDLSGTNIVLNAAGSHIKMQAATAHFKSDAVGIQYHDLSFEHQSQSNLEVGQVQFNQVEFIHDANMDGDFTIATLLFAKGFSYAIDASGSVQITSNWVADGSCQDNTIINSSGTGQCNINLSPNLNWNYVQMGGFNKIGAGSLTIQNGLDLGNNTNINIVSLVARTLYWVGGTGDWNDSLHWSLSSGGPGGECIPNLIDDVVFDQNSFSAAGEFCDIDNLGAANCHNLTFQNAISGTGLTTTAGQGINIAGSLSVNAGVSLTAAIFKFVADDLGNTIQTNGVNLNGSVSFEGTGEWTLIDAFNAVGFQINFIAGSLLANANDINAQHFVSNSGQLRNLDLSNVRMQLGLNTTAAANLNIDADQLTLNSTSSVIFLLTPFSIVESANNPTYHNVYFTSELGTGYVNGEASFNTLGFSANGFFESNAKASVLNFSAGYDYLLNPNVEVEIVQTLNAAGDCEDKIFIYTYPNSAASFKKSAGMVNVVYCDIENVNATGGATFNASNSFLIGSPTGWNLAARASRDFYWIGGDGDWHNGKNWSFSSGGAAANCIPGPDDDVFFDANSFSAAGQTVLVDTSIATCRDMIWTNANNNPTFQTGSELHIYGSLSLIPNMTWLLGRATWFKAQSTGHTVFSAGQTFPTNTLFYRESGGWTLLDSLHVNTDLFVLAGNFNSNGKKIKAGRFHSHVSLQRTLTIDNSEIELSSGGNAWQLHRSNLTFSAVNSHIKLLAANVHLRTLPANGNLIAYHRVSFLAETGTAIVRQGNTSYQSLRFLGNGQINGDNLMDTLILSPGKSYSLESGKTQTIDNFLDAVGSCNDAISISSSTAGNQATIFSDATSGITAIRSNLKDIAATGTATFTAVNSNDLGNNTGWTIGGVAGIGLYWIGDAGDWSDPNHWALSSGGPPSGCIPTQYDDVYFDQNSFSLPNQRVNVDVDAVCKSMWWTGAAFTPEFYMPWNLSLNIYGSLELSPQMDLRLFGKTNFKTSAPAQTIVTFGNNNVFDGPIFIESTGELNLLDSLSTLADLFLNSGTLKCQNSVISANGVQRLTTSTFNLYFQSSTWNIIGTSDAWDTKDNDFNTFPADGNIHFLNDQAHFKSSGGGDYPALFFHGQSGFSEIKTNATNFEKVFFFGDGRLNGSNYFDTLQFSPGFTYLLEDADTQYVSSQFIARGNNCFPIVIHSQNSPNPAFIHKTSGLVDSDFLEIKAIHGVGGANFYAGVFSTDAGFNAGWNFSNSGNYQYGLGPDTTVLLCTNLDTFEIVTLNFNGGISWLWQDGYTGPNYPATQSGLYTVTVYFANNCFTTDSVYVLVDTMQRFAEPELNICSSDTVRLSANGGRPGFSYLWNTGDTIPEIDVSPNQLSTYWVDVTFGNYVCRDSVTINVFKPEISFLKSDLSCFAYADGQIDASVQNSLGAITYQWAHGPNTASINSLDTGWYFLQIVDSLGCMAFDSIYIDQPTPMSLSFSIDSVPCNGGTSAFTYSSSGGTGSHTLDFGGLDPNALPAGTHNFALIDDNGCRIDTMVTVLEPAVLMGDALLINNNCEYESIGQIHLSPTGGTSPYTYAWDTGDTSASLLNLENGQFSVDISDANGCTINMLYAISANSFVEAAFTASESLGMRPLQVDFTNSSLGAHTYEWWVDSLGGFAGEDFNFEFTEVGIYEVMLVAFDTVWSCSDTQLFKITVEANPNISDPNVFTPNGDNFNDLFYFEGEDLGEVLVSIYNRWGQEINNFQGIDQAWDGRNFNGELVSPGTYFYTLVAEDLSGRPFRRSGYVGVFY